MKRFIIEKLKEWKESKYRKPLILKGARQVGKTYILKKFGEENYEGVAYFNFDHDEDLYNLFENTKDPKRILEQLAFIYGKAIIPGKTLIIFDEIQECPNALNALKYFYEEANEYHIACAGSLLGIRLSHTSFPVGKVEFMNMYPMTFSEFLLADNAQNLVDYMKSLKKIEQIPDIFFNQLSEKLKAYFIIGGMPEAVNAWVNEKNMELVNTIQENILLSYESDFSKHTQDSEANKISLIWNSIPSQLAKENKKFLYGLVKPGGRGKDYENIISYMEKNHLIIKSNRINAITSPLSKCREEDNFKLYYNDSGILYKKMNVNSNRLLTNEKLLETIYENNVVSVLSQNGFNVYNYHATGGKCEIDIVIQNRNGLIIPIEIYNKDMGSKSKSLGMTMTKYNLNFAIRLSNQNFSLKNKVKYIPYYAVFCIGDDMFI